MLINPLKTLFGYLLGGSVKRVDANLNIVLFLKKRGFNRFASVVLNRLQRNYGVYVTSNVVFDATLRMPHPVAIIIGDGVKLGRDITIYQNVTIGGARTGDAINRNYPEIGDGTVIFSGAAIIGNIKVGKNCIIGANSVVTKDIPDFSTAVGAPARVVSKTTF